MGTPGCGGAGFTYGMPEVLLLELEGVLVETSDARRHALARAFRDEGLPAAAEGCDGWPMARPPRESAIELLEATSGGADPVTIELVTARAEREFARRVGSGVSLRAGAHAFIGRSLGAARLAIVTRARRSEATTLLALASLTDAFEVIVSADDVLEPKPSPEGYEIAIQRLARRQPVDRASVLSLEDTSHGIAAALAAGVRAIAVESDALPAHDALACGAVAFIASLEEHSPRTLAALAAGDARQERGS